MAKTFKVVAVGIPRSNNGQSFHSFWSGGKCWGSDPTENILSEEDVLSMKRDESNKMPIKIISVEEIVTNDDPPTEPDEIPAEIPPPEGEKTEPPAPGTDSEKIEPPPPPWAK